jgi:hypothetical protein
VRNVDFAAAVAITTTTNTNTNTAIAMTTISKFITLPACQNAENHDL